MDPLQQAVETLGEHYDSVVIIVTQHEPTEGGSEMRAVGAGSFYTRIGSVREWLLKKEEETRAMARRSEE